MVPSRNEIMALIKCPVCQRQFEPTDKKTMPFCSARCQQIDLGRWLGERYSLPLPKYRDPDEDVEMIPEPDESDD